MTRAAALRARGFLLMIGLQLLGVHGKQRLDRQRTYRAIERGHHQILRNDVRMQTASPLVDKCKEPEVMAMQRYAFAVDCVNYYICIGGQIYQDQCPPGLAFDSGLSVCVDPARVQNCSHVANNRCDWGCLNGGYCLGGNLCHCPEGYYGFRCSYGGYEKPAGLFPQKSIWNTSMCVLDGTGHVITFDGSVYNFPGSCQYEMVSTTTSHDFKVLIRRNSSCIHNRDYQYGTMPCITDISILISQSNRITIKSASVFMDDKRIVMPYDGYGVLISNVEPYIIVKVGDMVLRWDEALSSVYVILFGGQYLNDTVGLCGKFDHNKDNDITNRALDTISLTTGGINLMARSWKVNDKSENCVDTAELTNAIITDCVQREEVQKICNFLWLTFFEDCHSRVNVVMFEELCHEDICRCDYMSNMHCHCNIITQFSRFCALAKGKVPNWRTPMICEKNCDSGQVWNECGKEYAVTCLIPWTTFDQQCFDRCQCPEGQYQHGNQCINKADCPCMHRSVEYMPGDEIHNCHTCVCTMGEWSCNKSSCPGTAFVHGYSHFKTFDDNFFTFQGKCKYLLAEDVDQTFSVIIESSECGSDQGVTCIKSFTVMLHSNGRKQEIKFRYGGTVSINHFDIQLPFVSGGLVIDRESSLSYFVQDVDTGLEVSWNGRAILYLTVPKKYQGKMKGLAGNFDLNSANDFISSTGVPEETVFSFGNSWKLGVGCQDVPPDDAKPCQINSQRMPYAKEMCDKLNSDIFRPCHKEINQNPYYKNCLYDICECEGDAERDCVCDAIAIYARACTIKGINLEWREKGFCDVQCMGGEEFQLCGSSCRKSCRSLSIEEQFCTMNCVEGCNCPSGSYRNPDGICVEKQDCPCYNAGMWYEPGESIYQDGIMCQCFDGILNCEGDRVPSTVCPTGQIYRNCTSRTETASQWVGGVECAKTCQNRDFPCPKVSCESGCMCLDGFVLSKDRCILPKECPCYHSDELFDNGKEIQLDCNTCVCESGKWVCTTNSCDGECHIIGESHFLTFDGMEFDFKGDCEYVLARDICGITANTGTFIISFKSNLCEALGYTCSRTLHITLGKSLITLKSGVAPQIEDNSNPLQSGIPFQISTNGFFIYVTTGIGVRVLWDQGTRIYIHLPSVYKGKVCGMCGDFNGRSNDDFVTPSKGSVSTPSEFGHHWRLMPQCAWSNHTDAGTLCDRFPARRSWAERQCSIIEGDIFSPCHHVVNRVRYYEYCLSDTCSCEAGGECECFCTAVAAYAHACSMKGIYVKWRSTQICPTMCELYNQNDLCIWKYEVCGNPCPNTCCHKNEDCSLPCVEGCFPHCPKHYVYDDLTKSCIPVDSCPTCPTPTTVVVTTAASVFTSQFTETSLLTTGIMATVNTCPPCVDQNGTLVKENLHWNEGPCISKVCQSVGEQCPIVVVTRNLTKNCKIHECRDWEKQITIEYTSPDDDPDMCCIEETCECDETKLHLCLINEFAVKCSKYQRRNMTGDYLDTNNCCPNYECVCKNVTVLKDQCKQWYDFKCEAGRTRVYIGNMPETNGCCPYYRCEKPPCVDPENLQFNGTLQFPYQDKCCNWTCVLENGVAGRVELCEDIDCAYICPHHYQAVISTTFNDSSPCCYEYECECVEVEFNNKWYKIGDVISNTSDTAECSTVKVIQESKNFTICPTLMSERVICNNTLCDVCEDEILDDSDPCCPNKIICVPKPCPADETCRPNEVESFTTISQCCVQRHCLCACTGIGSPAFKPFHCENTYTYEFGVCGYTVFQTDETVEFSIGLESDSCAKLYPNLTFPPVTCIRSLNVTYFTYLFQFDILNKQVYFDGVLVTDNIYQDFDLLFSPDYEARSTIILKVYEFGVSLFYEIRDQGVFNLFLRNSSLSITGGLCGDCFRDEFIECSALSEDYLGHTYDGTCVFPCEAEFCNEAACVNADICAVATCDNCTLYGYDNPCEVLMSPAVAPCFDDPWQQYKQCNESKCVSNSSYAAEQCSVCSSLTMKRYLDQCPPCMKIYETLGCVNQTEPNVTCPENQHLLCIDECLLSVSCHDKTAVNCGQAYVTACHCLEGYVKQSSNSDVCIKEQCCSCPEPTCGGLPAKYVPIPIGRDECGCLTYGEECVCTDECLNPNDERVVLSIGDSVIDSSNPCITYTCDKSTVSGCNYVNTTIKTCPQQSMCHDEKYMRKVVEGTENDCCPHYDCVCEYFIWNSTRYKAGVTLSDYDDDECTTWVVQYPGENLTSCPILNKQMKDCITLPVCTKCEEKINTSYDSCCGQIYECVPISCPPTDNCGPNQESKNETIGCCEYTKCFCRAAGIGTSITNSLDCREDFVIDGNCTYLGVKDIDSERYQIHVTIAPCIELDPTMNVAQDKTCLEKITLYYESAIYHINAHSGNVTMIGASSNDVSVIQTSLHTLIAVAGIGLEILYIRDQEGVVTITLDVSQSRETEGIFGNCAWSNTTSQSCPVGYTDISKYQIDSSCPLACGEGDTCNEERCQMFPQCFDLCKTCEDFGYDNPCLILLDEKLVNCTSGNNFATLLEECETRLCFNESITPRNVIETQCNKCTNSFVLDKIKSCTRDNGQCIDYLQLLNCETEVKNTSCPANQVYYECEDICFLSRRCKDHTSACGTYVSGCGCPNGYVKNDSSEFCVKQECCNDCDHPCQNSPSNWRAPSDGYDVCGCPIYTGPCVCTPDCENPENGGYFSPGELIKSSNPCVTYVCHVLPTGCGSYVVIDEYVNCPGNITCDNLEYTEMLNETASTECCKVYYCRCDHYVHEGQLYEAGQILPIDDGDPCTATVIGWPDNNTAVCPQPTNVSRRCEEIIECNQCQEKVNVSYDLCCGKQFKCVTRQCPPLQQCNKNQKNFTTYDGCCDQVICGCAATGIGSTMLQPLDCREPFDLQASCTYLGLKELRDDRFEIEFKIGLCAELFPSIIIDQPGRFCVEYLKLNYEHRVYVLHGRPIEKVFVDGMLSLQAPRFENGQQYSQTFIHSDTESVEIFAYYRLLTMRFPSVGLFLSVTRGVFSIELDVVNGTRETTGVFGNCAWTNTTTENCQLPPVNLTDFQMDPTCPPSCGEKDSCYEEFCEDATNCILECSSCKDVGKENPCLGLFKTAFSNCLQEENVTALVEQCERQQCFNGSISTQRFIDTECNVCTNTYVAQKIGYCKREKGICDNYTEELQCEVERTNKTCPETQVFMDCVDTCQLQSSCDDLYPICRSFYVSDCACPEGYVRMNSSSSECIMKKCCNPCMKNPCLGRPRNRMAKVIKTDDCDCDVWDSQCECTPNCVHPDTLELIPPGVTLNSTKNPCLQYFCPNETMPNDCGQYIIVDESLNCPDLAEYGCDHHGKVPSYIKGQCCAIECICLPYDKNIVCESEFHIKKYRTGECPVEYCDCECPRLKDTCAAYPGCKSIMTEFDDICHCPIKTLCVADESSCSTQVECDKCYEPTLSTNTSAPCDSPCHVLHCQKMTCPKDSLVKPNCSHFEQTVAYYRRNDTDYCCPIKECVCKPEEVLMRLCPMWNFTCPKNFTKYRNNSLDNCCPQYNCRCDKKHCPQGQICTWGQPIEDLPNISIGPHNEVCCNMTKCTCDGVLCEIIIPTCSKYRRLHMDNVSNPCCVQYECVCDPLLIPSNITKGPYIPNHNTGLCDLIPGQNEIPAMDSSGCFETCDCLPKSEAEKVCPDNIYWETRKCDPPFVMTISNNSENDESYACCEKLDCQCPDCGIDYVTKEEILTMVQFYEKVIVTSDDLCCPEYQVICKYDHELSQHCRPHNITCSDGYKKINTDIKDKCCDVYQCLCDSCFIDNTAYNSGDEWYRLENGTCKKLRCSKDRIEDGCYEYKEELAHCELNGVLLSIGSYRDHPYDKCKEIKCQWLMEEERKTCHEEIVVINKSCPTPHPCPGDQELKYSKHDPDGCCIEYNCECPPCELYYITKEQILRDLRYDEELVVENVTLCCANYSKKCKAKEDNEVYCRQFKETCNSGYKLIKNATKFGCCEGHHCICASCIFEGSIYNPGDEWYAGQNGTCRKFRCSSALNMEGCHTVEHDDAVCSYRQYSISVGSFMENPANECQLLACEWRSTILDDCVAELVIYNKECPKPEICTSEEVLNTTKQHESDCCGVNECVCRECGSEYMTYDSLRASLRDDERIIINSVTKCCQNYTKDCRPENELVDICSKHRPTCLPGFVHHKNDSKVGCCDNYHCICDSCIHNNTIYQVNEKWVELVNGQCTAKTCSYQRGDDGCYVIEDYLEECNYRFDNQELNIPVGFFINHPSETCSLVECSWSVENDTCVLRHTKKSKREKPPNCPPGKIVTFEQTGNLSCCGSYQCICPDCADDYIPREQLETNLRFDQMLLPLTNHECCTEYVAVCKPKEELMISGNCSQFNETCGVGYVSTRSMEDNGCCPVYHCICDPVLCPGVPKCEAPKLAIAYNTNGSCCPTYECECPSYQNKSLTCTSPYILEVFQNDSCLSAYCRCPFESECSREPTINCTSLSGCRAVATQTDECGCVTQSDCVAQISPCDPEPNCGQCFEAKVKTTYAVVGNCTTNCEQYVCERTQCLQPSLPSFCVWNEVSTIKTNDGCCNLDTVVCNSNKCPKTHCLPGYRTGEANGSFDTDYDCPDLNCCPTLECICEVCFYGDDMYKPGKTWFVFENGACKALKCTFTRLENGCYKVENGIANCVYSYPDYDIDVSVGAMISHRDDPCKTITCSWSEESQTHCILSLSIIKETCPSQPFCRYDEVLNIAEREGQCCESYQCECRPCGNNYITKDTWLSMLLDEQKLVVTEMNYCCPVYQPVCKEPHEIGTACDKYAISCPEGHVLKKNDTSNGCCDQYICECDVCFYNGLHYQVGDVFNDTVHGSCLLNTCSSTRDSNSCYAITQTSPICDYYNFDGSITKIHMNHYYIDPKNKCIQVTCNVIFTDAGDCVYQLVSTRIECQNRVTCPEFMKLSTISDSNDVCCPKSECICDDCDEDYHASLIQSVEVWEALVEVPLSENANLYCCPKMRKVCANDTVLVQVCEEWNKNCPPAYEKIRINSNECCPKYECVCNRSSCPPNVLDPIIHRCQTIVNETYDKNPGQECCVEEKVACKQAETCCENLICNTDERLKVLDTFDPLTGNCCHHQLCVCIENCGADYKTKEGLENTLLPGEVVIKVSEDLQCCPAYKVYCKSEPDLEMECNKYKKKCNIGHVHRYNGTFGCCDMFYCTCEACVHEGFPYSLYDIWSNPRNICTYFQCLPERQEDGCYTVYESLTECYYGGYRYMLGSEIPTNDPCKRLRCLQESDNNTYCTPKLIEMTMPCDALDCGPYEILKSTKVSGECCPMQECICTECGDIGNETSEIPTPKKYEKIIRLPEWENPNHKCCPKYKIVCEDFPVLLEVCPQINKTDCGPWQVAKRINDHTECCPEYECVCLDCPPVLPLPPIGPCQEYVNMTKLENPIQSCCPRLKTQCRESHSCCQIPVCDEYQEVYQSGGMDPEKDYCCPKYSCRCKDQATLNFLCPSANFTCPRNSHKVWSSMYGHEVCCQSYECKCHSCIDEGAIYPIGAVWCNSENHCIEMTCVENVTGECPDIISYDKYQCVDIDEDACLQSGGTLLPDMETEGCCEYCQTSKGCTPVDSFESINITRTEGIFCTSSDVLVSHCDGKCPTGSKFNLDTGNFEAICNCCMSASHESRMINLACNDGTTIHHDYIYITSCTCKNTACSNQELP